MVDIKGYEGRYAIEEDGTVWSYPNRANKMKMTKKVASLGNRGYLVVNLCRNNKSHATQVHRLIAQHFIDGWTPEKNCTNHKDGNKLNNSLSNLEWVTIGDNNIHAVQNGLVKNNTEAQKIGRRKGGLMTCIQNAKKNRRLSFAEAECIRQIKEYCKVSYRKLARLYSMSDKAIAAICTHKTYKEA